jgi:hypothetical protein
MRLRPGLFWRFVRGHERALKRRDEMVEVMVAQLIATVHNTSLAGYKHPIAPRDVMPSHWAKQPKKKRQTKAQREQILVEKLRDAMTMGRTAMRGVKKP